jgi:hypothetical protein
MLRDPEAATAPMFAAAGSALLERKTPIYQELMSTNKSDHQWLSGGGEMSELIRSTNWTATPLGPIETWPASLRTTVSLCLASAPINIIWGGESRSGAAAVSCGAVPAPPASYRDTWASAWRPSVNRSR